MFSYAPMQRPIRNEGVGGSNPSCGTIILRLRVTVWVTVAFGPADFLTFFSASFDIVAPESGTPLSGSTAAARASRRARGAAVHPVRADRWRVPALSGIQIAGRGQRGSDGRGASLVPCGNAAVILRVRTRTEPPIDRSGSMAEEVGGNADPLSPRRFHG